MTVSATDETAPAALYVGDLHPDVSDGQLYEAFSEFKSLASVRVCKDSATGKSLCYGYVNFTCLQDAIRAIELKNHSSLNGKVIRVMWSLRDADARKSGRGNVFVKNLAESIDNVGLHDLFQKYGNILSSKVVTSEDGKSKGFGYIQFESEESANAAIQKLNGSIVRDKQIYVGKFVKKSERIFPDPNAKYTNLYIKNLDPDITEALLHEKFSSFGKIISLAIAKDENGQSRCFGFVNYDNPDDARRAMEAMNGFQFGSKSLYVARAQKKAEREQILHHQFEEKFKEQVSTYKGPNVYVKNIDDGVSDEELRNHFSSCGTITSARVMRDDKGISKGFGFVCFSSPEEANKAVNTFHGCMFHCKPLYVAFAQRKEDRKTLLQLQHAQKLAGLAGSSTAVIPGGYSPYFYADPRPQPMHQPQGLRTGWRANGFAPPTKPFQQSPVPIVSDTFAYIPHSGNVSNNARQQRQNMGRMSGHTNSQGKVQAGIYIPQLQQSYHSATSTEESSSRQAKYGRSGRQHEMEEGSRISEMLHSMLAATIPEQHKKILGEHLYPLVQKLKPSLAAKVTGKLLELDNKELLLLLESPEKLSAKVDEAMHVLQKAKVSGQEPSNFLSAKVAVN